MRKQPSSHLLMQAFLVGSFLLAGPSRDSTASPRRESVVEISIDAVTWPLADRIEWPGTSRAINVMFDVVKTTSICGNQLSERAKKGIDSDEATFGIACDELFV